MLELIQITNDPAFARRCDALDGMRLFVDLERLGKAERQAGRNTFISLHEIADVGKVRAQLRRSRLMVRVNPVNPGTRAELQTKEQFVQTLDEDYWYGLSIFVPDDWVVDEDDQKVVLQWHTEGDQPGSSPILGLRLRGADWQLTRELGADGGNLPAEELWRAPFATGAWTDWVMHVRWSPGDAGEVRVWQGRELVYADAGPNMHPDTTAGGHYQKFGMYGTFGGAVDERTLYYDELRVAVGPSAFALVAP